MKNYNTEIIDHAIDGINALIGGSSVYGCDLHNELFNVDYFIIGRYKAEQWLIANGGVFNAIEKITEYEKDNFGEVNADLSEPEKVVNMYVYILGEEVLNECQTLQAEWNEHLSDDDMKQIVKELEELK
jgi:hypothetical protein